MASINISLNERNDHGKNKRVIALVLTAMH